MRGCSRNMYSKVLWVLTHLKFSVRIWLCSQTVGWPQCGWDLSGCLLQRLLYSTVFLHLLQLLHRSPLFFLFLSPASCNSIAFLFGVRLLASEALSFLILNENPFLCISCHAHIHCRLPKLGMYYSIELMRVWVWRNCNSSNFLPCFKSIRPCLSTVYSVFVRVLLCNHCSSSAIAVAYDAQLSSFQDVG